MTLEPLDSLSFLPSHDVRLCIAGMGGVGVYPHIWNIPGISNVLTGCYMPYAKEEIDDFLGFTPDGYCHEGTAMDFAMEAFYRAYQYKKNPAIGIGLVAVTTSTEAHRGDHRVFVATFQEHKATMTYVRLVKDSGEALARRILDGQICDRLLVSAIKTAVGGKDLGVNLPDGCIEQFISGRAEELADQRLRLRPFFSSTGKRLKNFPLKEYRRRGAILPGSFNPPHFGHFGMADNYYADNGGPVTFSIEGTPPHKDPIKSWQLLQRAKLLQGRNVLFTWGTPYYIDKVVNFPGVDILMGADNFEMLFDCKRWGITIEDQAKVLNDNGSTLVVVDRRVNGEVKRLEDFKYPDNLPCRGIRGNFDITSTEIREGRREPTAA
jgi:hypothetical protein